MATTLEPTLAERIARGDRVKVRPIRQPDRIYTIQCKEVLGLKFYGAIPPGKSRVPRKGQASYRRLERPYIEAWADALELVEVVAEFAIIYSGV